MLAGAAAERGLGAAVPSRHHPAPTAHTRSVAGWDTVLKRPLCTTLFLAAPSPQEPTPLHSSRQSLVRPHSTALGSPHGRGPPAKAGRLRWGQNPQGSEGTSPKRGLPLRGDHRTAAGKEPELQPWTHPPRLPQQSAQALVPTLTAVADTSTVSFNPAVKLGNCLKLHLQRQVCEASEDT